MGTLTGSSRLSARAALVLLWLGTAAVSLVELKGQDQTLLSAAHLRANWALPLTLAGTMLDVIVGLAIWRRHARRVYLGAGLSMLLMTLLASAVLPSLWLDPLGRLSKNLPIAALLFILYQDAPP